MKASTRLLLSACSVGFASLWGAPAAAAQFVSNAGNDANACTQTAPCATLAGAMAHTSAGGEIDCLNTGQYGSLDISQSVTVNCVAAHATVTQVNITTAGGAFNVVLEGLDVNGQQGTSGGPVWGLRIDGTGGHVTVRQSRIRGNSYGVILAATGATIVDLEDVEIDDTDKTAFTQNYGIVIQAPAGPTHLNIRHSRIGGAGQYGIHLGGGGDTVVSIDGSEIVNAANGIYVAGTGHVALNLRNTRITGTTLNGIRLTTATDALIESSEIAGNNNGVALFSPAATGSPVITAVIRKTSISNNAGYGLIASGAAAKAAVIDSAISQNGTGISAQTGSALYSQGGNQLVLNAANGAFTAIVSPQ